MRHKNTTGRGGVPIGGYPSLRQYRLAKRAERLKDVAERVAIYEGMQRKKDEHFQAWIAERCITELVVESVQVDIENDTRILFASYREFCEQKEIRPKTPQAWGRWMGDHFLRIVRNAGGIGRVYCGIALKVPQNVKTDSPVNSSDTNEL